jgi:signal recognition particle receptor subunit alpha
MKNIAMESSDESEGEEEEAQKPPSAAGGKKTGAKGNNNASAAGGTSSSKGSRVGFLSGLTSLVGSKTLTRADIQPALDKMKDHLIMKNVASEIADSLCKSVATKLEGKVLGTFNTVAATVKEALQDACVQLLESKKRVDILRDALDARARATPYVVTFCGVNGVGKSTNLAKVCFWLIENGLRVLIAACDTFRAGAVEQLRTHCRKLNALHPAEMHGGRAMVQLYEKGYGKDAAGIATEAIYHGRCMVGGGLGVIQLLSWGHPITKYANGT